MNEQIAKFIRNFSAAKRELTVLLLTEKIPEKLDGIDVMFGEIDGIINGYLEEQSIESVVTQYEGGLRPIIRVLFETEGYEADEYIGETPQIRGKRYAEIARKIIDRQAQNE